MILVTGVNGQLGHDVVNELHRRALVTLASDLTPAYAGEADGSAVTAVQYQPLDLTDRAAVQRVMNQWQPDAVIHCAAYTAVDAAEENAEMARAVNADATRYLAEACRDCGAKLMYISTDYVFDGQGDTPWQPDCKAFAPRNVYGQTKLAGEQAVAETLENFFIVRIAWVFGKNGKNFVKTMLRLGETHDTLRVVCDQIGTPTYTLDLARLLVDMITTDRYGYYHATNEGGYLSWAQFAEAIFRAAGMQNVTVLPITTAEYGRSKAARPFNSRLDKQKLTQNGFVPLPDWQDALSRYLKEIGK